MLSSKAKDMASSATPTTGLKVRMCQEQNNEAGYR